MKQGNITQIDLHDVPQVYHNLKYNDGEICFADNITSIPGLMSQFRVNFIAYVIVCHLPAYYDVDPHSSHSQIQT